MLGVVVDVAPICDLHEQENVLVAHKYTRTRTRTRAYALYARARGWGRLLCAK